MESARAGGVIIQPPGTGREYKREEMLRRRMSERAVRRSLEMVQSFQVFLCQNVIGPVIEGLRPFRRGRAFVRYAAQIVNRRPRADKKDVLVSKRG